MTKRRLSVACMLILCIVGCCPKTREMEAPAESSVRSDTPVEEPTPTGTTVPQAPLHEDDVAAIRAAIEASGGELQCDASGQPVGVDLALARVSIDRPAFHAAMQCRGLRRFRARAGQLSADDLRELASLDALEELYLQDAAVDDAILSAYAERLVHLKRLTLRNTPRVTDGGIADLARLPGLTHLALLDLQLTGASAEHLAAAPSLVSLDLRMSQGIQGADLKPLIRSSTLTELKLAGFSVTDATLDVLSTFPGLKHLTIEDASISGDGLARFARGENVERVESLAFARCAGLTDEACRWLAAFNNLRSLTLRDVPIMGSFLADLPTLDRLQVLSLNQTFLTDEAYEAIARCGALRRLELSGNYPTPEAIEKIASLETLEYLNLAACGLNDAAVEPLKRLPRVRTLLLDGNPELSPAAMAILAARSE